MQLWQEQHGTCMDSAVCNVTAGRLNRTQGSLLYVLMSTIGMKHGEILAQNNEFSTSYGNYLALSTVSGALMGGGLSYLFNFINTFRSVH